MKFNPMERRILAISWCGHFLAHFYMIMLAVVVLRIAPDFARDFGYDQADTLALTLAAYALFGLGSFPAGLITDRWNARWMLMICMIGCGACTTAAGLATGPTSLCLILTGVGLFASIYHPAGLALISRHIRARGWAMGINGVAGNLGVAAAPFAAACLSDVVGWRATFLFLGAPGILIGLLCAWLGALRIEEPAASRQSPPPEQGARYGLYFLILCGCLVFAGLAYRTTMVSAPDLFVERVEILRGPLDQVMAWLGLTIREGYLAPGALMLSAAVLLGCVGQLLGGYLADRHDLRILYFLFFALAIPAAFLCVYLHEVLLFLAMGIYLLFTLGMQSIENSLISRLTPDRWRSTAFGLKFILTFGIGSLGVILTGRILKDTGSVANVYVLVGLFTTVVAILSLVLYWISRRAIPRLGQNRSE